MITKRTFEHKGRWIEVTTIKGGGYLAYFPDDAVRFGHGFNREEAVQDLIVKIKDKTTLTT